MEFYIIYIISENKQSALYLITKLEEKALRIIIKVVTLRGLSICFQKLNIDLYVAHAVSI
jgi:hypothetical protein